MNVRNSKPVQLSRSRSPLRTSREWRVLRTPPSPARCAIARWSIGRRWSGFNGLPAKRATGPSAAARSLVNRRSDTIGVVVTNIADPFVAGVVSGIEETADQHGLSVFLANSNAEPEREVRVARKFEERRVDGIIVTASRVGAQYVPLFTHMQVPIVLLNNQHPSQFAHSVMIANVQASLDADTPPDCAGSSPDCVPGGPLRASVRYRAVLRLPAGAGRGRLAVRARTGGARRRKAGRRRDRDRRVCSPCPSRPPRSSAITICRHWARCGRSATTACGFPADISVVGFDDLYISQYLDPPLTTVRQPMRQMGRMAMEIAAANLCRRRIGARYQSPR